jgi:AcrR family transcriptional regulator
MTKNRVETEKAILDTVTRIVRTRGFSALGVNAVAKEAGVSKVLIYRYFGSYRDLLENWALRRNFWFRGTLDAEKALAEATGDRVAIADILKRLLRTQIEELREDTLSREILRWFIADKDAVAATVMARIEKRGTAFLESIVRALGGGVDLGALSAIVISGVYYLALITDRADDFNGVDISSDAGWSRLISAIDSIINSVLRVSTE